MSLLCAAQGIGMESGQPVITPMTALVVDDDGRLTYMGEDGQRRVIVGDSGLLRRISELRAADLDGFEDGCGI